MFSIGCEAFAYEKYFVEFFLKCRQFFTSINYFDSQEEGECLECLLQVMQLSQHVIGNETLLLIKIIFIEV